jgi:transcriptional regulator of acetoin/glycerol metabolism
LRKYHFPGNVRELENAIEHAFVLCRGNEILPEHLPESILKESNAITDISNNGNNEREVILESLTRNHGNKSRTAVELGINRSTLWRKLKSLGIGV